MSRNKQIEEMSNEIYETLMLEAECPLSGMDCAIIADLLIKDKSYRKASDVAREILADIERNCRVVGRYGVRCYFKSDVSEIIMKYTRERK